MAPPHDMIRRRITDGTTEALASSSMPHSGQVTERSEVISRR